MRQNDWQKTLALSKSSCFHEGFSRRQAIAGGQRSPLTAMRGLEAMERGNRRLLRLPAPAIHPAYTAYRTRTPHDGRAPAPQLGPSISNAELMAMVALGVGIVCVGACQQRVQKGHQQTRKRES